MKERRFARIEELKTASEGAQGPTKKCLLERIRKSADTSVLYLLRRRSYKC